jgi:hypothetical protein
MTVHWTDKWVTPGALQKYTYQPMPQPQYHPGGLVAHDVIIGGAIPDPTPIPEHLCPNCRRDWHQVPLTESVARMCDGLSFDEGYDPGTDVSRVVCPGSEFYGPAVQFKAERNPPGWGPSWTELSGAGPYSYPEYFVQQSYSYTLHELQKILTWPNPLLPGVPDEPWTFESNIESIVMDELKDAFPAITVKTWLPGDEDIQQAAIEAAPKAIEMAHKPPKSAGFDFSDFNTPEYSYPKGKKK